MYCHIYSTKTPACSAYVGITYKIVYKWTDMNNNNVNFYFLYFVFL